MAAMEIDARALWVRFETYHDVTYFTPESRAATDALGCKGTWMGYFGTRAAPLGPTTPEMVTATFYNFHPKRVAEAIPAAWKIASPEAFLRTRLSGVDSALRRMLPAEMLDSVDLAAAAVLVRSAAERAPIAGRPLAAANATVPWPAEPHLVLWQASARLRESRGDGHVAALIAAGLGPCEALVMFGADHGLDASYQQAQRGWSAKEWAAAAGRLVARGLLTKQGKLTEKGAETRRWVEQRTVEEAAAPWLAIGAEASARAADLLTPIAMRIADANQATGGNQMAIAPVEELSRLAVATAG